MKNIVTKDGLKITTTNTGVAGVVGTINLSVLDTGELVFSNEDTDKIKRVNGIVSSGTDYIIGDILTVIGGSGNGALLRVADVDSGGIVAFDGVSVINGGAGYTNSDVTYSVTGGSGTGFEFNALVATGGINVPNINGVSWPSAPSVGGSIMTTDNNNNGSWVLPTLSNLSDVQITTPVRGQVLVYNGTTWVAGETYVIYNYATSTIYPELAYTIPNMEDYVITITINAQAINASQVYSTVYYATISYDFEIGEYIVIASLKNDICNQVDVGQSWDIYVDADAVGVHVYVKSSELSGDASWGFKIDVIQTYYGF